MKKETNNGNSFWKDESGDFGIRQIAMTVAVIVLIGFAITIIKTNLGTWITDLWTMFMDQIEKLMS